MILITLAGDSSRFFNAGFKTVKYKLPFQERSVIEAILYHLPREEKLLIVLNKKFSDQKYFTELLLSMGFQNYQVAEIDNTKGQFESVLIGLSITENFWDENEPITIFNGDTIRISDKWFFPDCDGFIEVFESEGTHWSFVDKVGEVSRVTEKDRISSYCSSGLYFFRSIGLLLENKNAYLEKVVKEIYIAPFYNLLIAKGYRVTSGLTPKEDFIFCGTPDEYYQATVSHK